MKKQPDWINRFSDVVDAANGMAFDWAECNCCTFSADLFEAVTGIDPIAKYRGKAKTKKGALAILKRFGGGGVVEALEKTAEIYGLEEVPPLYAKRGDPVIAHWNGEFIAGAISLNGREVLALHPDKGLSMLPVSSVTRAWSIS